MSAQQIVQKLWGYHNVVRDDGLSYGGYVEPLTFLRFLEKPRFREHDRSVITDSSEALTVAMRERGTVVVTPRAEQADRLIRSDERRNRDLADIRIRSKDRAGQRWIVVLDNECSTAERITGERVANIEEFTSVRGFAA